MRVRWSRLSIEIRNNSAQNAVLGTFYISSYDHVILCAQILTEIAVDLRVPNFILAFIPAQINANTLNTMTAFAVSVDHLLANLERVY